MNVGVDIYHLSNREKSTVKRTEERESVRAMAVTVIIVFCVILLLALTEMADTTRVEMTTPINPVIVGGVLAIQCQIWNMQNNYVVNILRKMDDQVEQIAIGNTYMPSPVHNRVFLALRTAPDGSDVYFVTILDISEQDRAEYICKVASLLDTDFFKDSIDVAVHSYPRPMYPICTSVPASPLRVNAKDSLTLTCASEKTIPLVDLTWEKQMEDILVNSRSTIEGNMVYSTAEIQVDASLHRAVFTCTMRSSGFQDRERTCHVGPVSLISNSLDETFIVTKQNQQSNEDKNDEQIFIKYPSGDCMETCSPESTDLQFYLTIATFAAGLLMIIFLTTTIIMCCKYHHINSVIISDGQQGIASCNQDTEEVYVSLQRSSNYERVYMPFEEPNITENKVVLPKEVFDEFYQSLRMKSLNS